MFTEAFNARFMSLSTMKINVKVLAVAAFCAFSVAGQTASSPGTNVRSVPSFEGEVMPRHRTAASARASQRKTDQAKSRRKMT